MEKPQTGSHALHALRQGRVRVHGVLLVSRAARRSSGRVSHLRESVERRKDAVSGEPHKIPHPVEDEPPPILGTWRRIYIIVLCYLTLLIAGFYVFTRVFES